jgi:hypothetical protein
MSQTRSYSGSYVDRTPDLPGGSAWQPYGASASHSDSSNLTGYASRDLLGAASLAHALAADDGMIPSGATIQSVGLRVTLGQDTLVAQGALAVAPYLRYDGGAPVFQDQISSPFTVGFTDYTVTFPLDPDGLPWTRTSIFRKHGKLLLFGLRTVRSELPSASLAWSEARFLVTFRLPVPLVQTDPASFVWATGAQLNGRFNPRGANGAYPCSYWFEYGPTIAYGSTTLPVANAVGTVDLLVSATLTGLTADTGYHFRLVVQTLDDTYHGDDLYFSTNSANAGRFRLDEFKRVPTGDWNAQDRARMTSRGFDRASTSTDDSGCPFLVL